VRYGDPGQSRLEVESYPRKASRQSVAPRITEESRIFFGSGRFSEVLLRDLQAFAATPYPVLVLGPTGSGKTVLAKELHALSPRRLGPFVRCPLPSIPDELRHAELAGCRRGAYTGALEERSGAVEAAHGGTLFLDEIGYASLGAQQTLLTTLESGAVRRIGEVRERSVDVRFVCATTGDLPRMCEEGRFLPELFFRIECLTLQLPALVDRREDIVPLAWRFIAEELRVLDKPFTPSISEAVAQLLRSSPWPGNLRQLRSVCRFGATRLDSERELDLDDLPSSLTQALGTNREASGRDRALGVLARVDGNKAKAARILGITRPQLYRLLAPLNGLRTSPDLQSPITSVE